MHPIKKTLLLVSLIFSMTPVMAERTQQTCLKEHAKDCIVTIVPPDLSGVTLASCNTPVLETYVLQNNSPFMVEIGAPEIIDITPPSANITLSSTTCGSTLAANASCNIVVSFSLCALGDYSATLEDPISSRPGYVTSAISLTLTPPAVGASYDASGNNDLTLSYTSSMDGDLWTLYAGAPTPLPTPATPATQKQGHLFGAFCVGPNCVAVGESFQEPAYTNLLPLAYTSTDGGNTWALTPAFTTDAQGQGLLQSVACVDLNCASVGLSTTGNFTNLKPLGYISTNGGVTWSLPRSFSPSLPANTQAQLFSVDCVVTTCTTVGSFYNTAASAPVIPTAPLGYVSTDSGNTWSSTGVTFDASTPTNTFLNSVSCVGTTCTAVGGYFNNSNLNQPYSFYSTNSGSTWTASPITSASGQAQEALFAVDCVGTDCVAAGASFDSNGDSQLPLVYTSDDYGQTWTIASLPALLDYQIQAGLDGVTCVGSNTCIAVGNYYDSLGNIYPLAYTSQDQGSSWTLSLPIPPVSASQPQGQFFGIAGS